MLETLAIVLIAFAAEILLFSGAGSAAIFPTTARALDYETIPSLGWILLVVRLGTSRCARACSSASRLPSKSNARGAAFQSTDREPGLSTRPEVPDRPRCAACSPRTARAARTARRRMDLLVSERADLGALPLDALELHVRDIRFPMAAPEAVNVGCEVARDARVVVRGAFDPESDVDRLSNMRQEN
jgi:hypothetical protein